MLKRKMFNRLSAWAALPSASRKALFLTGARQVGKSYAVRELGQREFGTYCEINLLENEPARRALLDARNAEDFISRVTLFCGIPLVEGDTLVFIDEVQEAPDIMTMAKFLVEDGRFSWAFSGSMLGTELKGVRSYPVGYVHELTMRPLDFEEFCWAIGISDGALETIRTACVEGRPVEGYLHDAMLANFRTYLVVGGMPEVVQLFMDTKGDLAVIRAAQLELDEQYRRDISKYAGSRALYVREIFDQLPLQLEGESQRFVLSSIDESARYERYRHDFVWLVDAGVALKTSLVREPRQSLLQYERPSNFKLYQSDVGMLMARYPRAVAQDAYLGNDGVNMGALYENVVAQELVAQELAVDGHLHYFMNKKRGEVDFLVEDEAGGVVPIEVKSGKYYRRHAALDNLLESEGYGIGRGIVLSRGNVERREGEEGAGDVLYLPHYAVFCLRDVINQGGTGDGGASFQLRTHKV